MGQAARGWCLHCPAPQISAWRPSQEPRHLQAISVKGNQNPTLLQGIYSKNFTAQTVSCHLVLKMLLLQQARQYKMPLTIKYKMYSRYYFQDTILKDSHKILCHNATQISSWVNASSQLTLVLDEML